jgi:uncharacterized protein (DUF736 family)
MARLLKAIYMFNKTSIKIPRTFIIEIEKFTLKFIWKHKRLRIAKVILNKKSNAGGITIPNFKLHYRSKAIKAAWYWHKNRYEDQWNRTEDPDINLYSYGYLIFDKVARNILWRKDSPFNKYCWEKWLSTCRKLKLDPYLSPCTSIISKCIKDLNIRPQTLHLGHKTAENTLETIGIGNDFLSRMPAAQQLRERMDKWYYMKLRCFCTAKKWSLN